MEQQGVITTVQKHVLGSLMYIQPSECVLVKEELKLSEKYIVLSYLTSFMQEHSVSTNS